jgi:hypothetical protein
MVVANPLEPLLPLKQGYIDRLGSTNKVANPLGPLLPLKHIG